MTRSIKILRNAGIGAAVLVMVVVITLILVVRTDRFREYVRHKIITATEEGTGGRVEIGTFSFDWRHLRAVVTDFVVHGLEPADAAPYLRAGRVEIHIRLLTSFKHLLDIAYLGVDHPEANIMVLQDGSTNVPKPKQPSNSSSTPLETVVDLQVGQFQLSNGSVTFDSRKQDFNLRGDQLRVQLWFDTLKRGYKGEISLMPFYVVSGRNTPVRFSVTMPVTLERDRIVFQHGQIVTDASHLTIDGALENLREPKTSGHVWGHIALADLKNAANLAALANLNGAPPALDLDVNATMADNQIEIAASKISFGKSNIEASGKLQDPAGNGLLRFQANLALDELGRLERLDTRPEGMVHLTGTASMDAKQNYNVLGEVKASNVSFIGGTRRIGNVSLVSAAHVTPQRADLTGLRLRIFGGEIAGNASMEDFARYSVKADLRGLNLQTVSHEMGLPRLAYSGTISGPLAVTGDLRAAGATGLAAQARFSIAPSAIGIPVSGRLNADYQGAADNLNVVDSYVALPHTRLTMNGSVGRKLDLTLTSRDLRDFAPALGGTVPVELAGGSASFQGSVSGRLAAPQITGHLAVVQFAVQGRQFDALGADVAASTSGAAVSGGTLRHGAMQTQFAGSVGLRNWSPTQNQPLALEASVHSGDLADMFALAGASPAGYSGALTADVHVAGTVANPRGSANFSVTNGSAQGQPFDNAQVQVQLADQLVTIPAAQITSGKSRVNLTAEFHHPRDHFDRGQVHAHIESGQVDLAALRAVQNREPNSSGTLHLTADVTGDLRDSGFQLTNVTGDATGRSLHIDGQNFGDFTLTARTNAQAVTYDASSDFAGSRIRVTGNTQLATGYRTTADADISGLPIERMLAIAHRTDIPAQGTLTAKAHFAGTTDHPEGTLDATVDRGVFYDEPIDRIHASGNYLATSIELSQLEIRAGASVLQASARYDHAANDLGSGNAQFRVTNGHLDLARLRNLQKMRPGITGAVQFTASGSGATRDASPRFLARDLNLNLAAKGLAAEGKSLGDLTLTADTSGSQVHFALDSNLANASIQGRGDGQLGGDYPVQAQVTFHNVSWKGLQPLLGPADPQWTNFDAATEGQIAINGPLLRTNELRSRLQLDKVQLTAAAEGTGNRPVTIDNQGPVVLSLDHGVVKIESLKLSGPQTDVQAQGSVSLDARTLEASLSAHTDLSLLRRFRRDIVSSGAIVADARVRGTFDKPLVDGKLDLQNVSFNVADVPTGMANANGTVQFNGNTATVRNLTGEVGGGKLTLSGFVTYVDAIRFGLRAKATKVRVRLQPGVSAIADADVRLSGIRNNSVLSGTVTIDQVTYAPESDFGAILSRAAPPVQSPTAPSPVLDNMKLDIQVRTSSATALQASVAQNLQADANLHIQGTAAQPGVLGRISITEGRLVFFSSSYTVDTGTISFYNPVRIEPVLDLSLATKAKGVDVVLRVTGPVDNMKLTYTSEPPLQFQEIVGLLAAGQTPTSDPTLLANQPTQPPQSFEQMGETALLSKALADPVSNRLQRVFGVTQLKIDPTFSGNADLPQAQLTLQQQVTSRVTLTYSTALDNPNAQVLRGEFALNRQWSATATRDQYGIFSIKFQYKTQIR